jgi:hypothetical protein
MTRPLVSILETMDWPSFNGYSMPVTGRLVRKPGACVFDKKKNIDLWKFYEIRPS